MGEQILQRIFQKIFSSVKVEEYGDCLWLKSVLVERGNFYEVGSRQDWVVDFQYAAVFALRVQKVSVLSDIHGGVRHNFFSETVDWRVRYLREKLFEIGEEAWMFFAHHRKWSVDSHAGGRFNSVFGQRKNHIVYVLAFPAESPVEGRALIHSAHGNLFVWNL